MDNKTLNALQGSIKKWRRVTFEGKEDMGKLDCPLCIEFYDVGCNGCPVHEKGHHQCRDSPYTSWINHIRTYYYSGKYKCYCGECKNLAKQEYEFLKSLLPEGQTEKISVIDIARGYILGFTRKYLRVP